MGRHTDPGVLTSQLVRNLAWLPSFALTDRGLTWAAAGETAFEVRSSEGGVEAMVRFEIDDRGDVVRACSPSRPYDVPGGYDQSPWCCQFSDHREFSGTRIPAAVVATFEKPEGPWEYLRATVTSVTFETAPS